jgi:hypothetical protein
VGTAGAEQYHESPQEIRYGYLLVEVRPDGTLDARFQQVRRDDQPAAPGGSKLADYCFDGNNVGPPSPKHQPCTACPPG